MNRGERDNNRAGVDERRRRFLDEGEEVAEPDLAAILADLERERRVECFVEDVREHGVRVAVLKFVQSSPSFTDDIVVMAENCILASLLALKPTSAKIDLIMWGIGFRAPNLSHQEVVRCAPKPSVCGLVWKNGDTAYKCRTCESDPTCAICVQCFSEGDHTGHDYRMISTGGGCCDCGDRAAWQESGFCRHHRGSSSDDPSTFLPPDIVPTSTATLRATARYLSLLLLKRKGCPAEFRTKSDPSVAAAQVVVGCLLGLCKEMGEGMGRLLSLALCHIPAQSCSPLKAILISDLDIPDELRSQIHTLLFHLLGDQYFKAEFARSLIGNYHQLVRRDMEIVAEENNGILGFSVQLFTVKGLSCEMVTTASLLEVLCGTTLEFIQKSLTTTSSTSERPSVSVKALSRIQSKYWRLFTDLHYVLQHVDCAQALLYQHPIALKDFINIISFFQGMNPQCRAVKEHVLFPSTDWIPAVNLESEFMTLLPLLISGISIPPKIAPVDASRLLCASLDSWLSALQHSQYRGYELITYTPLADPLTFHLPLHRFVAQFLRAMVMDFGVSVTEILDNCSPNFLLCFMHHPLKIQAALSQIRLGLWVRNGSGVQEQAQIYKTSPISWDYGYRLDLFIIQFVASLLPASHILSVFLQAFCCNTGEVIWCGFPQTNVELACGESLVPPGTTSGLDKAQCSGLVEDFLSFVVTVAVSERSLCGIVDPEFLIRRELLHFLAIANQTHSSLEKHLPATLSKNPHFDDILSSLSSFIEPKAMEPGHFVISSKCWDEYDAYFSRYSRAELTKADERCISFLKTTKNTSQIVPCPKLCPTLPAFSGIIDLLHSHVLHGVIFSVLYHHAHGGCATGRSLVIVLHILQLALQTYSKPTPTPPIHQSPIGTLLADEKDIIANAQSLVSPPHSSSRTSILALLCDMHKSTSFAAYDSVITAVLRKFAQLDSECAVVVDAVLGPSTQPAVPSRKRLSTLHERQQAILSQFAAQQQAFAQKFSVEEDSEPSTEQSSVCVLCRENVDDTSLPLNPSGIVALCHQSGLLSQVGNIQKSFYHFEGVKLPDLLSGSLQFSVQLNQEEIREDSDTSSQGDNDSSLETPREAREDIRGLSEGERQLCSKANHGEVDMTVPPFAICAKELMRDIDTSVGTYISSCSHVMHLKCLNTYQASLLKRHLAGEDLHVDLNYGEFFCPACRKLANCVIPILATSEMPSGSSTTIPVDPTEAVRSGLVSLSHRVYQTQICCVTLPTFETCTFLSSALATTIGVLEVKLRSETDCNSTTPALFSCLPSQQTEQISHLFRAACANYRTDSRLEDLKHVLLTSLYNRTQLSNAPGSVFTADPFSIFVHLVCMGHRPVQEILCLAFAAEMAKILLVVQPLLSSTSGTYQISETEDVPSFPIFCDFVKQYSLKTGNWSGLKTGTTLEQAVPLYCLKFLRRAALFLHLTLNYPPSPDSSFSSLLRFLHLDSALCVAQTSSSQSTTTSAAEATPPAVLTPEILSSWFSKLFSSRVPTTVTCIPTVPLTLHPLPNSFSQLFCEVTTSTCTACGAKPPKEPALCLMCGKLMCLGGKSKPSGTGPGAAAGSRGECSEHSLTCSKGTGVFLLAKQAVIVLLLPSRKDGCMWGSVYLDVHREEDPGVKRGKPLFLDQGRCAQLSSLLLSHGVEDLCAQQRTVYLPNNWNAM